ncbi:MAG: hypothetical protein LBN41_03165 [Enterobacteriaceae bacterium]|nr:hypothetical protein [Enterobacteriaceae bacterium]
MADNKKKRKCPRCGSESIRKHGRSDSSAHQRYLCQTCLRTFQTRYTYNSYDPVIESRIFELLHIGKSEADICWILKINPTIIHRALRIRRIKEREKNI